MRAIVAADIHGDREALLRLKDSVIEKGVDYFMLLGDYSAGFKDPVQNEEDIRFMMELLRDFKVKAVPGNCDQKDALKILDEYGANLHNTVLELPEVAFVGFGGSNPTPFGTPFEMPEDETYAQLKEMMTSVKGRRVVMLVHQPPKDTACDVIKSGAHVGSASLRKIIEEHHPELVLCSHIHEAAGREDRIGKTRVINVGRISEGRAYMLDVGDQGVKIDFYIG